MIVLPQPSCHNRLKSLNSFSVSLLADHIGHLGERCAGVARLFRRKPACPSLRHNRMMHRRHARSGGKTGGQRRTRQAHSRLRTEGEIELRHSLCIDPSVASGYDNPRYKMCVKGNKGEKQFAEIHNAVMAKSRPSSTTCPGRWPSNRPASSSKRRTECAIAAAELAAASCSAPDGAAWESETTSLECNLKQAAPQRIRCGKVGSCVPPFTPSVFAAKTRRSGLT